MLKYRFPDGFTWGVSSSSYQIEGAASQDGRGPSIWDSFCREPNRIARDENGSVACDHYNRMESDIELIAKTINANAYRFSIAWPRVLPEGEGHVNPAGIGFYDRLVDKLLEQGIKPVCTCYHWDLPLALQKKHGGWQSRRVAELFAEYCEILGTHLGDRVDTWCTLNEPEVVLTAGYRTGVHAPGLMLDEKGVRQVTHHLLLAHGLGTQALRKSITRQGARIGLVHNSTSYSPLTESAEDISATREVFHCENSWLLSPVSHGVYPAELWRELDKNVPETEDGDLAVIATSTDYLGINTYFSTAMVSGERGEIPFEKHYPRTLMNWPVTPDTLYWTTRFVHELYGGKKPLMITESGSAWPDKPQSDNGTSVVNDLARIVYLREHLKGIHRAIEEGLPLEGYFVWSIMDNFEWSAGYEKRFGLIYIDYENQKRIPKASAEWYRNVIKWNGF